MRGWSLVGRRVTAHQASIFTPPAREAPGHPSHPSGTRTRYGHKVRAQHASQFRNSTLTRSKAEGRTATSTSAANDNLTLEHNTATCPIEEVARSRQATLTGSRHFCRLTHPVIDDPPSRVIVITGHINRSRSIIPFTNEFEDQGKNTHRQSADGDALHPMLRRNARAVPVPELYHSVPASLGSWETFIESVCGSRK